MLSSLGAEGLESSDHNSPIVQIWKLRLQGDPNFTWAGARPKTHHSSCLLIPGLGFLCRILAGGRGSQGVSGIWHCQLGKIFILRLRDWSKILPLASELFQPLPSLPVQGWTWKNLDPFCYSLLPWESLK